MSRYKVVPESQSGHCCFEATVVDTTKPSPHYAGMFQPVCECFDEADAKRICDALNHPLMRPLAGELVPADPTGLPPIEPPSPLGEVGA